MNPNQMTEQSVATDLLLSAKTAVRNCAYALTECTSDNVRKTINQQLQQAIVFHENVADYMINKGYYHPYNMNEQIQVDQMAAQSTIQFTQMQQQQQPSQTMSSTTMGTMSQPTQPQQPDSLLPSTSLSMGVTDSQSSSPTSTGLSSYKSNTDSQTGYSSTMSSIEDEYQQSGNQQSKSSQTPVDIDIDVSNEDDH
ncbi:Coat F domain protein [Evansella cellulosilytica DSM 2522]|uniref:Coat F domain protein n=2 Tax=Evansella TaxID=2837485 RepID=E6TVY2_EVAC2|nr:Coat F domain protein [Evansella cellulosilytica DSM 2522]